MPRQRGAIGFAFQVTIEPVNHLAAPIGIGNGVDEHNELLADVLDHRLLGCGEPVRQFQNSFRGSRLVGVKRSIEVVDGPSGGDELVSGGCVGAARVR